MMNKDINWKYEIGQRIVDDKRDLTVIDRKIIPRYKKNGKLKCNERYYKYYCNKCYFDGSKHYSIKDKLYKDELWVEESHLDKRHQGCSCCANIITVENINSIYYTDSWMVEYFQDINDTKKYSSKSGAKVLTKCPHCGRNKENLVIIYDIYKYRSINCICNDKISKPNKIMFNILSQLNAIFEIEYSPQWIGKKRYDFYIPSMNLIIEMDGGWHTNDNLISGQTKEESKAIDNYKDEQAKLHGIEVIRIDCNYEQTEVVSYIKNKITNNKRFNMLFDVNKILWDSTVNFVYSNLVEVACEYKNGNKELTSTEIGLLMGGFSQKRVISWLKIGNELNWCDYNSKQEMINSANKNCLKCCKQVEVFKNDQSIGIFISVADCSRKSKSNLGIYLDELGIAKVCRKERKTYKGFTFKYV